MENQRKEMYRTAKKMMANGKFDISQINVKSPPSSPDRAFEVGKIQLSK
jgi:hypothetical protein|tara:strand:- start:560 stop:706 length:147 start_codon:yes stop_codon:yes gene_type:complete